jgi:hypothetical protein
MAAESCSGGEVEEMADTSEREVMLSPRLAPVFERLMGLKLIDGLVPAAVSRHTDLGRVVEPWHRDHRLQVVVHPEGTVDLALLGSAESGQPSSLGAGGSRR